MFISGTVLITRDLLVNKIDKNPYGVCILVGIWTVKKEMHKI